MNTRRLRIGDLLVSRGFLSPEQVEVIVEHQQRTSKPFGELAERLFGVDPHDVEAAWVEQYLSDGTRVDLDTERGDPAVLGVLSRRQAWQFEMVPLRREDGQLIIATTVDRLPRAVNFAWRSLGEPVYLVVAEAEQLRACLGRCYPWRAMEVASAGQLGSVTGSATMLSSGAAELDCA